MHKPGDTYSDWKKLEPLPNYANHLVEAGDKLVVISDGNSAFPVLGEIVQVAYKRSESDDCVQIISNRHSESQGCYAVRLAKLPSNYSNMSLIKDFALIFKGEPEKTFQKAGITDAHDVLTEEGSQVFLSWMLKKHGEEFKKEVADEILDQRKKQEKEDQ